jgi:hypothetical protein
MTEPNSKVPLTVFGSERDGRTEKWKILHNEKRNDVVLPTKYSGD